MGLHSTLPCLTSCKLEAKMRSIVDTLIEDRYVPIFIITYLMATSYIMVEDNELLGSKALSKGGDKPPHKK